MSGWNLPPGVSEMDEHINPSQSFMDDLFAELLHAESKFPAYHSYHEAYAVILEELDEFWDIVRQQDSERDPRQARKELVQIAVTACRAVKDLGL